MTQDSTCLIVMSPNLEPLGEIFLGSDGCQINLSQQGDALLGPHITAWQTQGLDHHRPQNIKTAEGSGVAWMNEPKNMQSEDFAEALCLWLEDHGYHYLSLPEAAMLAWSEIQRMDIDPQKKYELAVMLRDLPIDKLSAQDLL